MTSALEKPAVPATSLEARERIVDALRLDLVGPWAGHELANEQLGWERPSAWYVTGILVPAELPREDRSDADEEEIDQVSESSGLPEESSEERTAAKRSFFPSSMGLSFFVAEKSQSLTVVIRWGDYQLTQVERDDGESTGVWVRQPRHEEIRVSLVNLDSEEFPVPDSGGLLVQVVQHPITSAAHAAISANTRSVSVFLVNKRPVPDSDRDASCAFQTEIEIRGDLPFKGQPDPRGVLAQDSDEQIADLHYADTPFFATGHGVSADWEVKDGECDLLRTEWIPSAEVERTETVQLRNVELSMDALGALADGDACRTTLEPLVDRYLSWISERAAEAHGYTDRHRGTAAELLRRARRAADRIKRGIEELATNPAALDAFKMANRAVAHALRRRLSSGAMQWRAFQLAFILQSIPGLSDPQNEADRETVDLLFFPTGGGKTEAYLGLAAFAMVLRRLHHPQHKGHQGAGVCVIMRYTLRLLTFDQLARAAGLVCALELEREENDSKYGEWPFEIGLWVGRAATPNRMGAKGDGQTGTARDKTLKFQANPSSSPSPIPLENCPWCGERFGEHSFTLMPNTDRPTDLRVVCQNFDCDFNGDRALPIVAVDEPLYRRLPAFLVATVDKFATLPWEGASGALLGGATHFDANGFYGPANRFKGNRILSEPLLSPDLVIQDELHLISGPLGTMAGLYETAIEALCLRSRKVRPKIVASTATIRRASDQIQALFARPQTEVFPPPGPDRRDSFFAQIVPSAETPARQYIGITAQGRSSKALLRRTVLALMGAAQKLWGDAGGKRNERNPADPYMSMLGYFNSLKELGGARRVLEEEVRNTLARYGRRRRFGESAGLFRDRHLYREVVELTSRVTTDKVATARRRLGNGFHQDQPVDCAIATNMISVGLDIPRLGLMVVSGQPKTTSEYIQATSRVGRDPQRPGLVIDLLNVHRHRDRSHFEHFRHYHETFYRSVEIASVTPFSARALDRGLAGALVTLARHGVATMTPSFGVERIAENRLPLERQILSAFAERIQNQPFPDDDERDERSQSVENRVVDLLDSWLKIVADYKKDGVGVQYQQYEGTDKKRRHLLQSMLARDLGSELLKKFRANRSLRDVETEVHFNLRQLSKGPGGSTFASKKAHGALRSSQVITTYGPGALIDLPRHAAIVGGLETWPPTGKLRPIHEPRLEAKIQGITKVKFPKLYAPPGEPTEFWQPRPMIGAYRFPEWFVVQERTSQKGRSGSNQDGALREGSRRLVPRSALDERDRFAGCPVVPTRFVRACPLGHVDDLDWRGYVHQDGGPCTRQLWLDERGTTGDLGQLVVRCECGKERRLYEAVESGFGRCRGRRPWLGRNANEDCDKQSKLLTRTATNAYFPQIVSVLSLPDARSELDAAIERLWDDLSIVDSKESLKFIRRKAEVDQALPTADDEVILQAIERRRSGKAEALPIKQAELAALLASEEGFGEDVPVNPNFHARRLPDSAWRDRSQFGQVDSVIQLHRLLEVLAVVGFTRLEPERLNIHGEFESDVARAVISTDADWFPAVENRGEGVFIQLRSDSIGEWLKKASVKKRIDSLVAGYHLQSETGTSRRMYPGGPYVLLHTLSHMLIQSLATNCGYPASAIRERIYAEQEGYGILLYTASSDAEGTLGGLVQQARRVTDHLEYAIRTGSLCSNDPICAQHSPAESHRAGTRGRELHGAACHGCTLISETSCEMRNEFLDRALVVPVLGLEDAAFFGSPS